MSQIISPSGTPTQLQKSITLKDTTAVVCDECQGLTFIEASVMRKVSSILTGAPKDSYVPVAVFICSACGHLNDEFLPLELKAELKPVPLIVH